MSKLADIVANSLIGNDFVNIRLGGRWYKVLSPTPRTLGNMLRAMSGVDEMTDLMSVIQKAESNTERIAESIAVCVYPDSGRISKFRRRMMKRRIVKCYPNEIREAFEEIIKLIYAVDFFLSAQVVKRTVQTMAKEKASAETPCLGK